MRNIFLLIILSIFYVLLVGCGAASTSNLHINTRQSYVPQSKPVDNAPTAYINDIIDCRKFVDKTSYPGDPTPAISSAEERSRTVGRKRTGFGNAAGSYKLRDGQTVQTIIREILEDALTNSGFNVIHSKNLVTKDTLFLNVSIAKYWTWVDYRFWYNNLVTDIKTNIDINNSDTIIIDASEYHRSNLVIDSNTMESINNAIEKFRSAAIIKFRQLREKRYQ